MTAECAVAALLESGGPVRVSMRPCCVLALVGGRAPADPELRESFVCPAAEPAEELPALGSGVPT
ncbi:hypothetical protein [Paractinoplanes rishiriensis]|uniref:Uncharacterized protein n=1 Tax=Paractinoplanes rishiriensis TaxID=1050105 RepID=A0A919K3P7_9ACTN|nr:hypothetical protein [Actinoplanes rishiriensis]GIE98262.1 hypothetical protein Ari01nite_57270 [Actinoplanes rishiriensis]